MAEIHEVAGFLVEMLRQRRSGCVEIASPTIRIKIKESARFMDEARVEVLVRFSQAEDDIPVWRMGTTKTVAQFVLRGKATKWDICWLMGKYPLFDPESPIETSTWTGCQWAKDKDTFAQAYANFLAYLSQCQEYSGLIDLIRQFLAKQISFGDLRAAVTKTK